MAYGSTVWGSDVPVSAPEVLIEPGYCLIDMGGFGFGIFGLAHKFTQVDYESFMVPYWAPLATKETVPY